MIAEIVRRKTPYFFLASRDGKRFLLLYRPYLPFEGEGLPFDAFYFASNALYHLRKELERDLAQFDAKPYSGNLKKLFADLGCGKILRQTLLAIPGCGTRTALDALELVPGTEEVLPTTAVADLCRDCGRCVAACPTGALQGGFDRARCLRDRMDRPASGGIEGSPFLLGCDRCQAVCPHNSGRTTAVPTACLPWQTPEHLVDALLAGKKALAGLGEAIGTNYVRPTRLALLAIAFWKDSRPDLVARFLAHPSEEVRLQAAKALNQ